MVYPLKGKTWTYSSLNRDCNRLASKLVADGMKKGDIVMVQLINCPEFVFAYIACHKTRNIMCPVSYRLSPGELAYIISDSKPKRSTRACKES